ncbi:ATP-binding protein [Lysinibacter sp. HNR]|uniref:sensor histidine kinase n=1 Tax=Lysinibacter sp. HNR TaxID=3031408 RepID=UPI002435F429|nr:ATP-binding protein [Lysinibacter sp. HNR]WGD38326.1 Spo0B domain-containing protein [Lysinibacter sp. HNR]
MGSFSSVTAPRRFRFATHVLILQLTVVLAIVVVSSTIFALSKVQSLQEDAKTTALAVAQSFAEDDNVREWATLFSDTPGDPSKEELASSSLASLAQALRKRTGALFVVVTDDQGLRLAHPNPDALGLPVSTSPEAALAGYETTSWGTGTLGESVRAKVPVYALEGDRVVGEVSVGFSSEKVFDSVFGEAIPVILTAALALALGIVSSILITRRLRRLTLDLQPEELVTLVHNQEAVLSGVDEGVIGLAPYGRVTVCNDFARQVFALDGAVGSHIDEMRLPAQLMRVLHETPVTERVESMTLVLEQRIVFVDIRPVFWEETGRGGQSSRGTGFRGSSSARSSTRESLSDAEGRTCLGRVIVIRDRTDVEALSRRLDAIAAMTSALRAQRHEFANRLHTISGLLAIDRPQEAKLYLSRILEHGPLRYPVTNLELLSEPYLQAFLGAKGIEAQEKGVSLMLGPETHISGELIDAEDATAVLGNLIDNAVVAAVAGISPDAWIEIEVMDVGEDLHLSVLDSGDGPICGEEAMPGEGIELVMDTQSAEISVLAQDTVHGLGLGLPLSRDIARRRGGDVWFVPRERARNRGTLFCAVLPGIIAPRADRPHQSEDVSFAAESSLT